MKGLQTGLGHNSRAGHHVDPTGAVSPVQTIVAKLSPALSPGVLDDPVRHLLVEQRVLVLPKANNQHSMVNAWREIVYWKGGGKVSPSALQRNFQGWETPPL